MLFGREPPSELIHLDRVVREMAGSASERHRAIGLNLMHDHRVGEERALAFGRLANGSPASLDPDRLIGILQEYRREWIAQLPADTFAHPSANKENHVFDLAPRAGLKPDLELVHVCNVTQKLIHIQDGAVLARLGYGQRTYPNAAAVNGLLDTLRRDMPRKRSFVERFLSMLDLYRSRAPWHPVWAASWDEFAQLMDPASPESWLETVGLQSPPEAQWLLVLRYRAGDAKQLHRPTQLEAGGYAFHFPSPKCARPPLRGGHPMNLANARPPGRASKLISEFVHAEIGFDLEHWVAAGELLASTTSATPGVLMDHRRIHYLQLCEEYKRARVRRWMRDPITLG